MALESERDLEKLKKGEEITVEEGDKRQQVISQAMTLLSSGVDPRVVGQILAGTSTVSFSAPPGNGLGLKDITSIVGLVIGAKEDREKDKIISDLKERIAKLESNPHTGTSKPIDPITYAKESAVAVKTMYETWKEIGLIRDTPSSGGRPSLDEIHEGHRHEEKMEELKAEREHKKELRKLAGDIPERVGRGLAAQIKESGMESFECSECGSTVYVPPGAGDTVTCGSCRMKFGRKKGEQEHVQDDGDNLATGLG